MPDLSDLLGSAYSSSSATRTRSVPEWSEESRLDAAFASWEPGPGPEAPAKEREMFVSATRKVQGLQATAPAPTAPAPAPAATETGGGSHAPATAETVNELQQAAAVAAAVDFALFDQDDADEFNAPGLPVSGGVDVAGAEITEPVPAPVSAPPEPIVDQVVEPAAAGSPIGAAVWAQDLAEAPSAVEAAVATEELPVQRESWRREDDDVLAGGGRFSIRLPTFRR